MTLGSHSSPRFFRVVATCSFASAITTLGLIFLPRLYAPVRSFEENIALLGNTAYTLRLWIYLAHPIFVLAAALGVALVKLPRRATTVVPGFIAFFVWGFTEMLQQALALVANHYAWRAGYALADEATRAMIRTQMFGFDAIWDALYVLLLIGFIIANVLYGLAFWRENRFETLLAILFFAAATLSVFNLLGAFRIATWADPFLDVVYPLLQPPARALLGVWLWKQATRLTPPLSVS